MSVVAILASCSIVLLGSLTQGVTGFGFALVAVPILVHFADPKSVVVVVLILSAILNFMILLQARRHVILSDAGPIVLGTVLGVPFGTYLLLAISSEELKLLVAVLILIFAVPMLLGYSRTFRHVRTASVAVGLVSGALQSSTSMGGPPVVLFMAAQEVEKRNFRGTLVLRSVAASTLSVLALVPSGLVTSDVLIQVLYLAPTMIIGFVAGSRLLGLVPDAAFRKLVLILIAATAVSTLVSSFF